MRDAGRLLFRGAVHVAILFVLSTLWIWALANAVEVSRQWEFDDIHAYLSAARRITSGEPLYITADDLSDLYLYAPWFAVGWIPFTALPALAVEVAWAVVLVAAFLACLWPYWRTWAALAVALVLGSLLYRTVGWGNVQPLVLAALIYLLPTRAGPLVLGVAASLKPWPILGVAVYAWKRQWRAVAISLATPAVLWLPVFLFNWHDYPAGERGPNIYDITFLLALPPLLKSVRAPGEGPAQPAPGRSGSPEAVAG